MSRSGITVAYSTIREVILREAEMPTGEVVIDSATSTIIMVRRKLCARYIAEGESVIHCCDVSITLLDSKGAT